MFAKVFIFIIEFLAISFSLIFYSKVEFCSKEYISKQQSKFNFQFWDIGGQERYIYMTHVYYKNADYCLIMFDLTNKESFEACAKWKLDLDQKYRLADGSKCPCLLIGNKVNILFLFFLLDPSKKNIQITNLNPIIMILSPNVYLII